MKDQAQQGSIDRPFDGGGAGAPEPDGGTERAAGGAERATGGTTAVKTWAEALEESRGAVRKQRVQGDERGGLRRQGSQFICRGTGLGQAREQNIGRQLLRIDHQFPIDRVWQNPPGAQMLAIDDCGIRQFDFKCRQFLRGL